MNEPTPTARLWVNREETREGKFLLVRRDGTLPLWPHFALGARDPYAAAALLAYAATAEADGAAPEFVTDVRDLATEFINYRAGAGDGDPQSPPHRRDHPTIIELMRAVLDGNETALIELLWEARTHA